eukprot:scaffold1313_cov406-Prasinococcus_capsulatus_cf.AAC.3
MAALQVSPVLNENGQRGERQGTGPQKQGQGAYLVRIKRKRSDAPLENVGKTRLARGIAPREGNLWQHLTTSVTNKRQRKAVQELSENLSGFGFNPSQGDNVVSVDRKRKDKGGAEVVPLDERNDRPIRKLFRRIETQAATDGTPIVAQRDFHREKAGPLATDDGNAFIGSATEPVYKYVRSEAHLPQKASSRRPAASQAKMFSSTTAKSSSPNSRSRVLDFVKITDGPERSTAPAHGCAVGDRAEPVEDICCNYMPMIREYISEMGDNGRQEHRPTGARRDPSVRRRITDMKHGVSLDETMESNFVYDVYLMVRVASSRRARLLTDGSCEGEDTAIIRVDGTEADWLVADLTEEELEQEYESVRTKDSL